MTKILHFKPHFSEREQKFMSNYRPITLLPSFDRILEKGIYTRLYQHSIESNVLSKHQYSFRLNSWTEKVTFIQLKEIYGALNKRIIVGDIFCNPKKAFDCVDHGISLSILKFCGIRGEFLNLVNKILGGQVSESTNKCKKLTQHNIYRIEKSFLWDSPGFSSRALLFLIHISDLPLILVRYSFPVLVADDTIVVILIVQIF